MSTGVAMARRAVEARGPEVQGAPLPDAAWPCLCALPRNFWEMKAPLLPAAEAVASPKAEENGKRPRSMPSDPILRWVWSSYGSGGHENGGKALEWGRAGW